MQHKTHLQLQFGNYLLHHRLGQKGSAEIYLGTHVLFHNRVAIKFLSGLTEDDFSRFVAQASALTRLRHPHIVPILDFGTSNGTAFLVMDYVPNGHLRQRHPRGTRLPLETIVNYVNQVAAALNYIHQHNLVHRDVKPHNMLLGEHNQIMLGDFGIAVTTHSIDSWQKDTSNFEGTAPYAAPEQLMGEPRRASDQYSLAITIYEWLSGDWPFRGSFEDITHQHLFAPPPPLRANGIPISPEAEQVLLKALAKEPEARFAHITAFATALEEASNLANTTDTADLISPQRTKKQFLTPRLF